jgi:hypothetical protein
MADRCISFCSAVGLSLDPAHSGFSAMAGDSASSASNNENDLINMVSPFAQAV